MWRPVLLAAALLQFAFLGLAYTELKNIVNETNIKSGEYDVVVFICDSLANNEAPYDEIQKAIDNYQKPLQVREMRPEVFPKYDKIGVYKAPEKVIDFVKAMEEGRYIHRDLCATDEERMTAANIVKYIKENVPLGGNLQIEYEYINKTKYPMIAAVDRLYENTPKYKGRIVHITYTPPNDTKVNETLFFVGKGITFDTGGYSLKTGGSMLFMRKDKCGATSIVGFMRVLDILKPKGLKVNAKLAFVRNGIGDDAYLVDEIIPTAAGVRSRIGSTDAEGRNVMVDLLVYAKQEAVNATNPHLFTVATLTGHVALAYGKIPAAMDNGPARSKGYAKALSQGGALVGDPIEISTLRREDYEVCFPVSEYEDLQQRNTHANTVKYRGHQYPAAWMLMASRMTDYGLQNSATKLPYTHMDVSNAVGVKHGPPTGTPVPMLVSTYILPRLIEPKEN
ncbi:metalloexopeptidase activity [Sparganum proliferum]